MYHFLKLPVLQMMRITVKSYVGTSSGMVLDTSITCSNECKDLVVCPIHSENAEFLGFYIALCDLFRFMF